MIQTSLNTVQLWQAALPVNAIAAWLRAVSGEGECLNALPTTYTQTRHDTSTFRLRVRQRLRIAPR